MHGLHGTGRRRRVSDVRMERGCCPGFAAVPSSQDGPRRKVSTRKSTGSRRFRDHLPRVGPQPGYETGHQGIFSERTFGARDADRSTVIPTTTQGRKIFDQGLERFLEEGRALAKFQGHPCIASVLTFFRENGTSYLVMKYTRRASRCRRIMQERGGRIDYRQAMSLAMPVMDALRVVHEAGILHRDISPDNMFINRATAFRSRFWTSRGRASTIWLPRIEARKSLSNAAIRLKNNTARTAK